MLLDMFCTRLATGAKEQGLWGWDASSRVALTAFLFLRQRKSFCDYFCPKHMYMWLETRIIPLQCQYWLIRKVHAAWDGHHGSFSGRSSPFSTKPTTIFEENSEVSWLFWPKKHVCIVVTWYYTSLNSTLIQCQGS